MLHITTQMYCNIEGYFIHQVPEWKGSVYKVFANAKCKYVNICKLKLYF